MISTTIPPPPPAPVPNGPLAKFLLDPNQANHEALSGLMHWLQVAIPFVVGALGVTAGLSVAVVVTGFVLRRTKGSSQSACICEIELPPTTNPKAAEVFWASLHELLNPRWKRLVYGQDHVVFEMIRTHSSLQFRLWVPNSVVASVVRKAVTSAWSGSAVRVVDVDEPIPSPGAVCAGQLRLSGPTWLPIKTDHAIDPWSQIIGSVADVGYDEGAVIQIALRPVTSYRMARLARRLQAMREGRSPTVLLKLLDVITPGKTSTTQRSGDPLRTKQYSAGFAKVAGMGWEGTIRYAIFSNRPDADAKVLRGKAHALASSFASYTGDNRFRRCRLRKSLTALNKRNFGRANVFSLAEVATLAHLPEDNRLAGVVRAGARIVEPSLPVLVGSDADSKSLGRSDSSNAIGYDVAVSDCRYHFHIVGSTGTGKSTLLANLILQDIDAGRGTVVIDPKGDLVDDILVRLDASTLRRTCLIDPRMEGCEYSLDVLGEKANQMIAVENVVGIFRRVFEAYWGPRTDDVFRAACLTLVRQKDNKASLVQVPTLLTNPAYRRALMRTLSLTDDLRAFWDDYDAMTEPQRVQLTAPLMNKLRAFLLRDFVRYTVGRTGARIDMPSVLDGGVVLARLPKGIIGDEPTRLLGSLIVSKVWQAATARSAMKPDDRKDASLYVDECQNFLNLPRSVDEILAEARGYRLSLTLAHQHLSQLPRDLRDSVSSNARNKAFFNMSPEDATALERHVSPVLAAHDLSHLDAYRVAVRTVAKGQELQPATLRTVPLRPPTHESVSAVVERLMQLSGKRETEETMGRLNPTFLGEQGESGVVGGGDGGSSGAVLRDDPVE